jgi:hypothetical protein
MRPMAAIRSPRTVQQVQPLFISTMHSSRRQQLMIDANFAKLVDDDRHPLPVLLVQYSIEQRGLPGTEVSGQDGHRSGSACHEQSSFFAEAQGHARAHRTAPATLVITLPRLSSQSAVSLT